MKPSIRLLTLLAPAVLVAACITTGAEKADKLYAAGEYQRSADAYRDFIRMEPKSTYLPEAYLGLAWSEYKLGNYAQASEAVELMRSRYPGHRLEATAAYLHAMALAGERRYVECSTELRELLRNYPNDAIAPDARFLLARSEAALLRYASAEEEYRKYLEQYSDGSYVAAALLGRAQVLEKMARWSDAGDVLADFLRRFPNHSDRIAATIDLARYRMAYSHYDEAESVLVTFRKEITASPSQEIEAVRMLAQIYEQTRRTDEAIAAWQQLRDLLPRDSEAERMKLAVRFADYYVARGDTDRAREYYRDMVERSRLKTDEDARALAWLAADELAHGRREAAVGYATRYLESYPGKADAAGVERMLIDILVSSGRVRDGRDRLAALLKKTDAFAAPSDYLRLASLDMDLRDYDAALEEAKEGLARARRIEDTPAILSGLYHCMIINNLNGDLTRAVDCWWNLKDINPDYVTVTEKVYWDAKEDEFYRKNRESPTPLRRRAAERRGLLSVHVAGFQWSYGDTPAMELSSSLRALLASSIAVDPGMSYVPQDEVLLVDDLVRREDFSNLPDTYFPLRSTIGADWIVTGSIRTDPVDESGQRAVVLHLKLLRVDYDGIFPFDYVYKFLPVDAATVPPTIVRETMAKLKLYRPER